MPTRSRLLPVSCSLLLCSQIAVVATAQARQTFYDVHVFPTVNSDPSMYATAMNEQGVIIGYSGEVQYDSRATPIAIRNGRVVEGPKPLESLNYPLGLAGAGLIVGTSSTFPYAWVNGRPRMLRPANGLPQGNAYDANAQGIICGDVVRDFTGAQYPVIWPNVAASGITLKGLGGTRQGSAFAINQNNQVAGALRDLGGYGFVAVRWDHIDRAPRPLGVLPDAINSEGLAINNLGDVAARSSFADNTIRAFVYIEQSGELIDLGHLGGGFSFARGINDRQQVVGDSTVNGEPHGFIWQSGEMTDLNDRIRNRNEPFLYISNAVAIDSQGRIAAEVRLDDNPNATTRIALLTPVP